jgi:hypothetical protein
LYKGTGFDTSLSSSNYDGTDNTWVWRAASSTNAIGGAVITNASGVRLFLPAAGYRVVSSGALDGIGTYGDYWSSTYYGTGYSYVLDFYSSGVYSGNYVGYSKAYGFSVRCVAE